MASVADIIEVTAPDRAEAGSLVTVEVRVKNIGKDHALVALTSSYDGVTFSFSPESRLLLRGEEGSFTGSFIMPGKSITVLILSWYLEEGWWVRDDGYEKHIGLREPALQPTFSNLAIDQYKEV